MRTALASLAVVAAAAASIGWATAGFSALTAEDARQIAVERAPIALPDAPLTLADGAEVSLASYLKTGDRSTIVNFVFTRCADTCAVMGSEFLSLNRDILGAGAEGRVHLLSVSFDPEHDTPEVLSQYAARFRADPRVWSFATIRDRAALERLLRTLGVVVIPDGAGGYQHNGAFLVVDPAGRLAAIAEPNKPHRALSRALELATP